MSILSRLRRSEQKDHAACPYCGHAFGEMPARSRKCPECGERVERRAEYDARRKQRSVRLMTVEQGQRWDAEREGARQQQEGAGKESRQRDGRAAVERDLREFRATGVVKRVEVLAAADACDDCKALHGKTFPLGKAKGVLPVEHCSHAIGWCRCTWIAHT